MTIADLGPGEEAAIGDVLGGDGLTQRLAELGFTRGQTVRLVRFAPLGDPLQVRIRGFDVALRQSEARRIVLDRTCPAAQ
jgi:Fe2+ transport system protein FeoA